MFTGKLRNAVKQWAKGRGLHVSNVSKGSLRVGANFYTDIHRTNREMTPADAKSLRRVVGSDYSVSAVNGELRFKG